jgi:hypothetical protein
MSSYHTSFKYNDKNSFKDMNLIVVSFEPDEGFMDSFLSIDNVSDDYFDGTKKFNYGSKYNTSAEIQITVIKRDGSDMKLKEFRSYAKWLTGARTDSWLDMYAGDELIYSFLGKFTNMEQYKLDARTVGFKATFSSISPWAYSAPQVFDCSIGQPLGIDANNVLIKLDASEPPFGITEDGVLLLNSSLGGEFNMLMQGVIGVDTSYTAEINNQTDDLYTYIYLDIDYENEAGDVFSVKNQTLDEETLVTEITDGEHISISAKQFIISDIPNKIFGDSFNFIWPRLAPGINQLNISGSGKGRAQFTYRYPMKVGDCTMDIDVYGSGIDCGSCPDSGGGTFTGTIAWKDITDTPTTIEGYGITDAYTMDDVDNIVENIEISGGGSGSVSINESDLNAMLNDILQ